MELRHCSSRPLNRQPTQNDVLLASENYGIFCPPKVTINSAATMPACRHNAFKGSEKGRTCHGSRLILDTDTTTTPNRPDISSIIGPLALFASHRRQAISEIPCIQ
jgi:hypothetical protein